jgi:hypothetical protein
LPFPGVVEPVDLVEFDCSVDVDQVGEHATLPTAENWRGSPTRMIRHLCRSARRASSASFGVEAVAASSTITVVPAGRSKPGSGGRVGW